MSVFLKCAGGKRQLLPELRKHVPEKFGRYFEPFVGGGALFFDLREQGRWNPATLNDRNAYIATAYRAVRQSPKALIRNLTLHAESYKAGGERYFYDVRKRLPALDGLPSGEATRASFAAKFLFLNRTCFNGLWRVNKSGAFNVPHGDYKNPTICMPGVIAAASKALTRAEVFSVDFEEVFNLEPAKAGDFVYFDPPYWPVGGYADFTEYTKGGFGPADQERLRDVALKLKKRGVRVLLSNADVAVRKLYAQGFEMRKVTARRAINSKTTRRGSVGELLIW